MKMRWILLALPALLAACGEPVERDNSAAPVAAPPPMPGTGEGDSNAAGNAIAPDPRPVIAGAIPEAFRGTYDQNEENCARPSEYRLTVDAGELRFHESIGKVRSVKVMEAGRIEVLADYQGEGETWQNVRTLELDGKRLTISGEGTKIDRLRCPDEAKAGVAGLVLGSRGDAETRRN
ncbi:MAG TPA: hypothetical protein VIT45_17815 [Allosphingosinicella sp.]